jgi:hypothetical protein
VDASVREVEDWVEVQEEENGGKKGGSSGKKKRGRESDGGDFCAARKRLPLGLFGWAMKLLGKEAAEAAGREIHGLRVLWADGSTLRVPNTRENAKYFGYAKNGKRKSRTPVARMLVLLGAGSGAVSDYVFGPYLRSEMAMYWDLLRHLKPEQLLVADANFSSYLAMAKTRRQGAHLLTRLSGRRGKEALRQGINKDWQEEWRRPSAKSSAFPERLKDCPETQQVRLITCRIERKGYRSFALCLLTTLLEVQKYPADELVEQYLCRWGIELQLRTLKTYYGLAHLTAKSPEVCEKEVCGTIMAYNLVGILLGRSGVSPLDLSHKRARQLVRNELEKMLAATPEKAEQLLNNLLQNLVRMNLRRQQRPAQPRAVVQRPGTFPVLMISRKKWRKKYLAS